jgi:hypothetical protein
MARDTQPPDPLAAALAAALADSPIGSEEEMRKQFDEDPATAYAMIATYAAAQAAAAHDADPRAARLTIGHARVMAELSTRQELSNITELLGQLVTTVGGMGASLERVDDTLHRGRP